MTKGGVIYYKSILSNFETEAFGLTILTSHNRFKGTLMPI